MDHVQGSPGCSDPGGSSGFSPLLQIYRFDNLEKNVDGRNRMDYAFIRIFVEAIQEYDDVLVERLFNEEDIE